MENTTKKIIKRLACVTSALIIAGGAVIYSINKTQQKTIATLGKATYSKPVIILDAGHGERS